MYEEYFCTCIQYFPHKVWYKVTARVNDCINLLVLQIAPYEERAMVFHAFLHDTYDSQHSYGIVYLN